MAGSRTWQRQQHSVLWAVVITFVIYGRELLADTHCQSGSKRVNWHGSANDESYCNHKWHSLWHSKLLVLVEL